MKKKLCKCKRFYVSKCRLLKEFKIEAFLASRRFRNTHINIIIMIIIIVIIIIITGRTPNDFVRKLRTTSSTERTAGNGKIVLWCFTRQCEDVVRAKLHILCLICRLFTHVLHGTKIYFNRPRSYHSYTAEYSETFYGSPCTLYR